MALYLFYGPTPISKDGKILAYPPVNIVVKILYSPMKDYILGHVKTKTNVIIKSSQYTEKTLYSQE